MQPWRIRVQKKVKRQVLQLISPVYRPGARQKVILFHGGRSGSSVLSGMLTQHPEIYWAGEVLAEHFRPPQAHQPAFDYRRYLARLEFSTIRPYFGIEIKPVDLLQLGIRKQDFLTDVGDDGYTTYIVLERKNQLRKIVSIQAAKQSGIFHVSAKMDAPVHKLALDVTDLAELLQRNIREMDELKDLLQDMRVLYLTYEEDILPGPATAYQRTCAFLGIRSVTAEPRLRRIAVQPLSQILTNYSEVAASLVDTPYAWMLDREYPAS